MGRVFNHDGRKLRVTFLRRELGLGIAEERRYHLVRLKGNHDIQIVREIGDVEDQTEALKRAAANPDSPMDDSAPTVTPEIEPPPIATSDAAAHAEQQQNPRGLVKLQTLK
jgi:hypothetical protein